MKQFFFLAGLLSLLSLGACQASFTMSPAHFPKQLKAEPIKLKNYQGHVYHLPDLYEAHVANVFIFFQSSCPCVKRYQSRIQELSNQFSPHNIAFFYVSSNNNESYDTAQATHDQRLITLPLLRDEGGIMAKAMGAKGTPAAAVINQSGEMVFLGWIDNERPQNETGRIAYLEDALKDIVHKRPVATPTSPMFGCPIR